MYVIILLLSSCNSETSLVTPISYYRIVIIMIRCGFLQPKSFENSTPPAIFFKNALKKIGGVEFSKLLGLKLNIKAGHIM